MPAKVKVRVIAGRDLPVMDRASDLTDAFVEVRLGQVTHKTEVLRKSLNPHWNSEWFRFEVDDEELQDEQLQIRVFDYDTYSAHDSIGKVYVDLNPLLLTDGSSLINGWFPIYDTMHGIRGEINIIVKLELFTDVNRYKQSSCGIHFFSGTAVPVGYKIQSIYGFLEELVVNDDPEYQWIDKIRTSRTSNEARQRLFSKLSGELTRKIGIKVLEMGGNSVLGYRQCFDLEGESGIVARGIGTCVYLIKTSFASPHSASPFRDTNNLTLPEEPHSPTAASGASKSICTPVKQIPNLNRRSSDSDLSTPPKGSSLAGSSGSGGGSTGTRPIFRNIPPQPIDMLDYPFFTMQSFPPGILLRLGGVVSARSVKLLDKIHNPDEPETRDTWWTELRSEIRSHARAMGCHAVIGYSEQTSICDEVIILSATGTAAMLNLGSETVTADNLLNVQTFQPPLTMSMDRATFEKEKQKLYIDVNLANQAGAAAHVLSTSNGFDYNQSASYGCEQCHIPYSEKSAPFPINLSKCVLCKKYKVPDVILATVCIPENLVIVGKGCFLQARICRPKKDFKSGEATAKEISDNLPFMEYELHNQLINKLRIKGMNALFGLEIQVAVGENMLIAIGSATAVYAAALPVPNVPKVTGKSSNNLLAQNLQKQIVDLVLHNKEVYDLSWDGTCEPSPCSNVTDESEDDLPDLEWSADNKDTVVLEIDDAEDEAGVSVLLDNDAPKGFYSCNSDKMPGLPNLVTDLQMITSVWQGELGSKTSKELSKVFDNILKSLFFHLRSLTPCCLCRLSFNVEAPDKETARISTYAMVCGVGEPSQNVKPAVLCQDKLEDLMFHMEDDGDQSAIIGTKPLKSKKTHKAVKYHTPLAQRYGVNLTPLCYIPGGKIETYVGNLSFFYIRESTSVKECGGLAGFVHSVIIEVQAIVRAHVAALGGNALVSYRMTQCVLQDNPHKNQGQCLINVCGDAVQVTYDSGMQSPQSASTGTPSRSSISPRTVDLVKVNLFPLKKSADT